MRESQIECGGVVGERIGERGCVRIINGGERRREGDFLWQI
jgi:hypothetical protein